MNYIRVLEIGERNHRAESWGGGIEGEIPNLSPIKVIVQLVSDMSSSVSSHQKYLQRHQASKPSAPRMRGQSSSAFDDKSSSKYVPMI